MPVIDATMTAIRNGYGNGAIRMDLAIGIGGAAGQGIATPGDILARIFVRRGLHLNTYNAYQSIVRGGHIFLTLRTSDRPVQATGDKLDLMITLNQDTMDRHLELMGSGSVVLYNADKIQPGTRPTACSCARSRSRSWRPSPRATWCRTRSRWRRRCN